MPRWPKKYSEKQTLSSDQREKMVAQIENERNYRDGLGNDLPDNAKHAPLGEARGLSVDKGKINRNIGTLERAVKEGTPQRITGTARAGAEKEHKEIADWIREKALTRNEMGMFPRHGYEFHRAVRKSKAQEAGNPEFSIMCLRYKELGRALYP